MKYFAILFLLLGQLLILISFDLCSFDIKPVKSAPSSIMPKRKKSTLSLATDKKRHRRRQPPSSPMTPNGTQSPTFTEQISSTTIENYPNGIGEHTNTSLQSQYDFLGISTYVNYSSPNTDSAQHINIVEILRRREYGNSRDNILESLKKLNTSTEMSRNEFRKRSTTTSLEMDISLSISLSDQSAPSTSTNISNTLVPNSGMQPVPATIQQSNIGDFDGILNHMDVPNHHSSTYGPGFESDVEEELSDDDDDTATRQYRGRSGDYSSVEHSHIGPMTIKCVDCGALHFPGEIKTNCRIDEVSAKFMQCCRKGDVSLPPLSNTPGLLKTLYDNNHVHSLHFKEHIRQYNSALAFASMVATPASLTRGPYSFVIHGQVYHNSGCLNNDNVEDSQYAQLYVLDSDQATELRMRRNQMVLKRSLLQQLSDIMRQINPLAKSYDMMQKYINAQTESSNEIFMVFDETRNYGSHRHNVAVENEIAAVFVSNDGEVPSNRALIVRPKGGELRRISILNHFLDPMTYPLFFPHGERGWTTGMKLRLHNQKTLTLRNYYAYRLGYRPCSVIHQGGKLFQQYLVDAYCKIEENDLNYVRQNQKKLRAESYKGLMDHLQNEAEAQNVPVGRRIILPSSFTGSPRNMTQNYQDAMTMVGKLGRPDLFLTFTCNPRWEEVLNELEPGQRPCDRPDIIARVFKMKLDMLSDDLFKENVLGRIMGHVGVIEFQKRGLPHVHLLLFLHPDDKIKSRKQLDNVICAEIPDESDPVGRDKVLRHMIHGPCGEMNPNCPCMVNGECKESYPKSFSSHSRVNKNGYPIYKRRVGTNATVGRHSVGNEWVVPYNMFLLKKYDAHINLELCASVRSIKYVFKYIYKGHDAASLRFTQNGTVMDYDEVNQFVETRYVSSHEACWRIFQFPLQLISHTIIRLAVHEEEHQTVVFESGQEEEALDRATNRYTTLTAFFALNSKWIGEPIVSSNLKDPRNHKYTDLPRYFRFISPDAGWKPRFKNGDKVLGRMYFVNPNCVEKFHMRLLLLHTKGAISFESLRTINGIVYPTYKEACQALGLVEVDGEIDDTLNEACRLYGAAQIREIFANLLGGSSPTNPEELWAKYKDAMSEDLVHRGLSSAEAESTAYSYIKALTEKLYIRIEDLIVPPIHPPTVFPEDEPANIMAVAQNKGAEMYSSLNSEQKAAADDILSSIINPTANNLFFIDGPGGSGKTYLYKALDHIFRGMNKTVLNVAWSGIAAQLLFEGRTSHSAFGLPVPVTKDSFMPSITANSKQANVLRNTNIIIWDEAPMTPKFAIEGVDILLQDIMNNEILFGGKVVLFGGDFRQIPPIVKERHKSATLEATMKRSFIWKFLKQHKLSVNMRARGSDAFFRKFLMDIGDGKIAVNEGGIVKFPEAWCSKGDLVEDIYGQNLTLIEPKEIAKRAILSLKNSDCDKLNEQVLNIMPDNVTNIYFSRDSAVSDESTDHYPIEYLNSLTPSGLPPHELKLKVGCAVMLLRNLNIKKGLCNGTRLIVQKLNDFTIECKTVETEITVVIPRINLTPCDAKLPFTLKRKQFPIRLCFSMTVNKSQGQSFDKVGLYLPTAPFSHGQLYVALSRCRTADGLKIIAPENQTKNVVLHELLV